jgi:hypothetical protein
VQVPVFAGFQAVQAQCHPIPSAGFSAGFNGMLSALLLRHNWERVSWRDARPFVSEPLHPYWQHK